MNTKDAEALLKAATLPKGPVTPQQWREWAQAKQEISRLGFTPATLAVASTLADTLRGKTFCELYGPAEECSEVWTVEFALDHYCPRCRPLAEWDKL